MSIDSLIFDLDGTLWNASAASAQGWNRCFAELGIEDLSVSEKDIESVTGLPFSQCVERLVPSTVWKNHGAALEQKLNEYEECAAAELGGRLYPGVSVEIPKLAAVLPLYIVSNCQEWYLECFLEKSGLRRFFSGTDCHGRTRQPKGATLAGLLKRSRLRRGIYIGDTCWDQAAAREAGARFGFVRYGFGSAADAEFEFDSFADVSEQCRRLARLECNGAPLTANH